MRVNLFKFFILITLASFFLNSCGYYKRSDIKDNPVNVNERVKRNIEEGRGISCLLYTSPSPRDG